jgi:hypothetical protein
MAAAAATSNNGSTFAGSSAAELSVWLVSPVKTATAKQQQHK